MNSYKLIFSLAFCLFTLLLQAQVPAPQSVAITLEASAGVNEGANFDPISADGEPQIPQGDHEVVVVVELGLDQGLQQLHLQISDASSQQAVLNHSFDLIAMDSAPQGYTLQRNGKIITINLGTLSLPQNYSCEVKVEDVSGASSPATIFNSSL
ncbi:MAG: hypothetical protein AAFP19_11360 [Bacteroidota bacterium]